MKIGEAEGMRKGKEEGRLISKKEFVMALLARGMKPKEIAQLVGISLAEVRRLAKS